MTSLAVFDFDRTIVDDDSDATVIRKLSEKRLPPIWHAGDEWLPFMSDVFEYAYASGFAPQDILDAIGSMKPTYGVDELIISLASEGWDIVFITDANSVFVDHWLKVHGLKDCITEIITNRGFWHCDRLYIEPCMRQTLCSQCPTNLCKSLALKEWCKDRCYSRICYTGDGRNDYCPSLLLPASAVVFPRLGYPLHDKIKKTLASQNPDIKAKVVPWEDCYTIIKELMPHKNVNSM